MRYIKEYNMFKPSPNLSEGELIKIRIVNDLREYYPLNQETLDLIDNFSNELIKSLKK